MLPELFYFLKGYVIIKIEGKFPEKFINIALKRNLYLWEIKRLDASTMTMKISVRGYFKLRGIGKKSACKVSIVKKSGMPFEMRKHRKRTAFVAGIVLFFVGVIVLSGILWKVEVTGNERVAQDLLLYQLEESGLKPGMPLSKVDTAQITQKVLAKNNDLAWIGINIKGTKASVEVVENVPKPAIVPKDVACNIVSTQAGVVQEMIVRLGVPVVKVGDTVESGQLLVSGLADSRMVSMRFLHADAEVKVKTWPERQETVSLSRILRTPTGKVKKKYRLSIAGFEIPFYFKEAPGFTDYDIRTTEKTLGLNPLKLQKIEQIEVDPTEEIRAAEEVLQETEAKLQEEIKASLPEGSEIVNFESSNTQSQGEIQVKVVAEAIVPAAQEVVIDQEGTN